MGCSPGSIVTLLKRTGGPLILGLILINIGLVLLGVIISVKWPALLSSIFIAYTLGLRHAVDADHLAAIDNVTRKMVSEGKKPISVGLFFSLGHSTIVFFLTFVVAISASFVNEYYQDAEKWGEVIGTSISATFLLLIGFINLYCLIVLTVDYRRYKRQARLDALDEELDEKSQINGSSSDSLPISSSSSLSSSSSSSVLLSSSGDAETFDENGLVRVRLDSETNNNNNSVSSKRDSGKNYKTITSENQDELETVNENITVSVAVEESKANEEGTTNVKKAKKAPKEAKIGFCNRLCPRLLNIVDRPYKMYFVGFLFGLGFDTATEVALLSMAAVAPDEGVPPALVLILPLVFAAGMALIDTTDGILMIWAYGWAFVEPEKKFFYNFFVTITSLLIALVIGSLEVLGVLSDVYKLQGPFWDFVNKINFETVGYFIIVLFVACFVIGVVSYYFRFGSSKTKTSVEKISLPISPSSFPHEDTSVLDPHHSGVSVSA